MATGCNLQEMCAVTVLRNVVTVSVCCVCLCMRVCELCVCACACACALTCVCACVCVLHTYVLSTYTRHVGSYVKALPAAVIFL